MQSKAGYENFIDEYMDKVPLVGKSFTTDVVELHTYIVRFASGNTVVEAKMVAYSAENNGQLDFMALKYHYEGVGFHAVNTVQDDKVLNYFFIQVKKTTHVVGRI